MKYDEIENAFLYVSAAFEHENYAYINTKTGEIIYASDFEDMDEDQEDEYYANDDWVSVPHKNALDLGRNLVYEFASAFLPDDYERIRDIFRSKGAYARFKELLMNRGKLQDWYDFENEQQKKALLDWCKEKGIEINE